MWLAPNDQIDFGQLKNMKFAYIGKLYRYFTRGRPGVIGVNWAKFLQGNRPYS